MRFLLYAAALLVMIAGDQALKGWTVSHLELGESTPFIPAIMQLTRVHNYGAAWSSLSGKTVLLIAVTAVMMIAVAVLLIRRVVRHPLGVAACLLILGGGIGNIVCNAGITAGYGLPYRILKGLGIGRAVSLDNGL